MDVDCSELLPFIVRLGCEYDDVATGSQVTWFEELVYAENVREAEELADDRYGVLTTRKPFRACSIRPATEQEVEYYNKRRKNEKIKKLKALNKTCLK